MTAEQEAFWKFYCRMFGESSKDPIRDDKERVEIAEEMRRVVEAFDAVAGGSVIEWWGNFGCCSEPKWNATPAKCAAEIRRRWRLKLTRAHRQKAPQA